MPLPPVAVRQYGPRGHQVVVLHGGPGAPGSLARLAIDLAAEFQVKEPLQRRSGTVPLTVDQHVADLAAVLDGPVGVVGHSWGAMLGCNSAAAHPELVDRLVLVSCGTFDDASRAARDRVMTERLGAGGLAQSAALAAAMSTATGDDLDRLPSERGRQSALRSRSRCCPTRWIRGRPTCPPTHGDTKRRGTTSCAASANTWIRHPSPRSAARC